MELQKCTLPSNMPSIEMTASVKPNAFLVIDNKRITASDRHFTLDNPNSRDTPVFEFVKYTITSEGKATIKNTVLNASTYQPVASFQIECEFNNGLKAFS